MERRFNATGERRKEMVKVISGIVGMKAVYMRMPTCAYAISNFTVSKEGTLAWDERSSEELVEKVLAGLAQAGFTAEPEDSTEEAGAAAEETTGEPATDAPETAAGEETAQAEPQEAGIGLAVSLPRESFTDAALENLHRLVEAKAALIKKALAVESLPVEADAEKVSFPWFADGQDGDSFNWGFGKGIHALHHRPLRHGAEAEARHGEGTAGGQREIRLPVLPAPARLHRGGIQGRAEGPAEEPFRQRQLQERGEEGGGRQ